MDTVQGAGLQPAELQCAVGDTLGPLGQRSTNRLEPKILGCAQDTPQKSQMLEPKMPGCAHDSSTDQGKARILLRPSCDYKLLFFPAQFQNIFLAEQDTEMDQF